MDFQELQGTEITITGYSSVNPQIPRFSRPKTAPTLRDQFLLALHKARSHLQTRTMSKPTMKSFLDMSVQEQGSRFPKAKVSWVKPAHKFVRFCEKRKSRPQWNAWKLRPSFQVNALPLMSTIVANKATEHVISPILPTNLEHRPSQSLNPTETEAKSEALAKAQGRTAVNTSKSYIVLKTAEKDEVKKLMTVVKATIRRTRSRCKLPNPAQILLPRTHSVEKISQSDYHPSKGHLRLSLQTRLRPRPTVPSELGVFGATLPPPSSEAKTVTPVQDLDDEKKGESAVSSGDEGDLVAYPTLEKQRWFPLSGNPMVVVKVSKGRNLQISNTGLALDVDSSSVTVRSPEPRDMLEQPRQPLLAVKPVTAPFGAMMKGRKIVDTGLPGVRFPVPQTSTTTPNHFLAGRSRPMPSRKSHSLL